MQTLLRWLMVMMMNYYIAIVLLSCHVTKETTNEPTIEFISCTKKQSNITIIITIITTFTITFDTDR